MKRRTGKPAGKSDKPRGDRRSGQNNTNGSDRGSTETQSKPKRAFSHAYPEVLKIQACVAAMTVNPDHPSSYASLEAARAVLGAEIAPSTISLWLSQYQQEITALVPVANKTQLIQDTQQAVLAEWFRVENLALKAITAEKAEKSALRDLAVVAGISRTHLSKMIALDAEMINSVVKFQNLCQRLGVDSKTMLDDYSMVLERRTLPPATTVEQLPPSDSTDSLTD